MHIAWENDEKFPSSFIKSIFTGSFVSDCFNSSFSFFDFESIEWKEFVEKIFEFSKIRWDESTFKTRRELC